MVASTGAPAAADAQSLIAAHLAETPGGRSDEASVTYRRDRFGEDWHLIPAGELGVRSRSLCGEPRQGTSLSETYADIPPVPPESVCPRCVEAKDSQAPGR